MGGLVMPELKKVRVREAKERDLGLFRKLWKAFLTEQRGRGAAMLPSSHNMEIFDALFNLYVVEKSFKGFILFVGEQAILMAGNPVSEFESSLGEVCYGWGAYVAPEYRGKKIGKELYSVAREKILEMGFDHFCATHLLVDVASRHVLERAADGKLVEIDKNISISRDMGVTELESTYVVPLKEDPAPELEEPEKD
jgi:GNAT superfamily N-acetyltransferase